MHPCVSPSLLSQPAQLSEHTLNLVTTSATCNAMMTYDLGNSSDDDMCVEGDGMAPYIISELLQQRDAAQQQQKQQKDWSPADPVHRSAQQPAIPGGPASSALDEINAVNDHYSSPPSSMGGRVSPEAGAASVMARVNSLRSQISKTAARAVAAGKPLATPLTKAASQAATATTKAASATFSAVQEAVAHSLPTASQLVSATDSYEEFPEEAAVAPMGPLSMSAAAVRSLLKARHSSSSTSASGLELGTLSYYNSQSAKHPMLADPASKWMIADDAGKQLRYIVIQAPEGLVKAGSRLASSELVTFESYSLGAKVNAKLYQEASALYNRFMPLLLDFLEEYPNGKVQLTGVGLGGGLAELLGLMLVHRGLRHSSLAPVYGLNAPPVLCEVPDFRQWCSKEGCTTEEVGSMLEDMMTRGVLSELGLPQDAIRNVYYPQALASAGGVDVNGAQGYVDQGSKLPKALKSWMKMEGVAQGAMREVGKKLPLQILNPLGKVLVFGGFTKA